MLPRRRVRQPGWMDEYEGYILPQAVRYGARATSVREDTDWSREMGGFAEMTPSPSIQCNLLGVQLSSQRCPQSHGRCSAWLREHTTAIAQCPPAVMEMLQQLQEDNQRLQLTVMDMRRQMTSSGAVQLPPSLYTALLPGPQESPLHVEVEDTWLPPPPPLTPAPPHQLRVPWEPRPLPVARDRDVPEEYWPPPPPPVAFPDDVQPPRVPPAPPVQPHGLAEEVRERLQRMEARLSPAPSLPSDAEQYDSVPQSATPPQQLLNSTQLKLYL
ncbi:hypothetical protein AAFF_G00013650 [Aldrovandia affinis]|uniref:Uncharacterized protein n=1 Tax=Aldrovandia affinis TaxID=143900 RepID=A0AAD7S6A0_9TELE|nr:hypothetical protein AAFF_G00013650 [Aldrovandia affinis]